MKALPEVWLIPLNQVELAHALYRCVFMGKFSDFEARQAWQKFEQDCAMGIFSIVAFPENAWTRSIDLARRYGPAMSMRPLDSLHVACAIELRAQHFWTFDDRQARLAQAAGLDTNP
jgi:predicted nucleic acid-binding protein